VFDHHDAQLHSLDSHQCRPLRTRVYRNPFSNLEDGTSGLFILCALCKELSEFVKFKTSVLKRSRSISVLRRKSHTDCSRCVVRIVRGVLYVLCSALAFTVQLVLVVLPLCNLCDKESRQAAGPESVLPAGVKL
jgi:hypothetical protein